MMLLMLMFNHIALHIYYVLHADPSEHTPLVKIQFYRSCSSDGYMFQQHIDHCNDVKHAGLVKIVAMMSTMLVSSK